MAGSFSKEGVKNISSMFKLSRSQSVTLEQKQSQGKKEKSKSTLSQGGLMHTNGFCHLWPGKIYDSAPQSCKQSTKQQTLAPYGILQRHNLKAGAGRVGGESRPQKSAPRHFLFKPAESDMAFEERRRGSIINPHFLLQTADTTLTALSAKPAAREGQLSVRTCPESGRDGPRGPRGLRAPKQGLGRLEPIPFQDAKIKLGKSRTLDLWKGRSPGRSGVGTQLGSGPPPALD